MCGLFLKKIQKFITNTNPSQKRLNESNGKPNKILVNKDSESYCRSMKSWFQDIQQIMKENLSLQKDLLDIKK